MIIKDSKLSMIRETSSLDNWLKREFFLKKRIIIVFCLFHFLKRPLDNSFFYAVATLLGVLTSLVVTPKTLQGFEPKNDKIKLSESEVQEINVEGKWKKSAL